MFPQAVPPEISGSFWKGPCSTPAKHLPHCLWLRASFLLLVGGPSSPANTSAIPNNALYLRPHCLKPAHLHQMCYCSPWYLLCLFQHGLISLPLWTASLPVSPASPILLLQPLAVYLPWLPTVSSINQALQFNRASQSGPTHLDSPTFTRRSSYMTGRARCKRKINCGALSKTKNFRMARAEH